VLKQEGSDVGWQFFTWEALSAMGGLLHKVSDKALESIKAVHHKLDDSKV
jgi:hypothetical protein